MNDAHRIDLATNGSMEDLHDQWDHERIPSPHVVELTFAAKGAYNAISVALDTLLACDQVSMLRHPQIVDGLHQALNGLKRAIHFPKPCAPNTPP